MPAKEITQSLQMVPKIMGREIYCSNNQHDDVLSFEEILMLGTTSNKKNDMSPIQEEDKNLSQNNTFNMENNHGKIDIENSKDTFNNEFVFNGIQNFGNGQYFDLSDDNSIGVTGETRHQSLMKDEKLDESNKFEMSTLLNTSSIAQHNEQMQTHEVSSIEEELTTKQIQEKNLILAKGDAKANDIAEDHSLHLTDEEQILVSQFLKESSSKQKERSLFLAKMEKLTVFPKSDGPPFLTPVIPLNMLEKESISLEKNDNLRNYFEKITQTIDDIQMPAPMKISRIVDIDDFTREIALGSSQQVLSPIEDIEKSTSHYVRSFQSAEFISQLKEHFQKFQNGFDKKLTVHMRSQNKNLTIIFNMSEQKGLNITFRTADEEWKNILEKSKQDIEGLTKNMTQTVHIRYLGE